jgi:hypothetical protein
MIRTLTALLGGVLLLAATAEGQQKDDQGWLILFNGKDLAGWKLRRDTFTVTRFVDPSGKEIPGAKKTKLDQKEVIVDAKGKEVPGAKVVEQEGKKRIVDAGGKPVEGAKLTKVGGRDAIVDKDNKEIKDAKAVTETVPNPTGGWSVIDGVLVCGTGPHGSDLYTAEKFTDFELHVEFQATSNSGVYLQGRYEIQVDNSVNAKPKIVEKDGKKIETLDTHQCGAIYGRIAPSKNMAKPPKEWQSYDVIFHGARVDAQGKVSQKARVTLIWNGEKVIDNAEIDGPTGGALDGKVGEPGPLMLQGDHGRVSYRNVKIRPLPSK